MSILAKSTPSQVCFLLIELVLVLLFLLFLAAAVFTKPNIGSAAGMFISALLTVILVKRSAFVSLVKTAYKTQAGKGIINPKTPLHMTSYTGGKGDNTRHSHPCSNRRDNCNSHIGADDKCSE